MDKIYNLGLIVGRFQVFHLGHEKMIKTSLQLCNKTIVFIGSAQESMTQKNPFSYEFRYHMLNVVFVDEIKSGALVIKPLNDIGVGNNNSWGKYVLNNAFDVFCKYPDILISGKEDRRINWFDSESVKIAELYIPKEINISATDMRQHLIENDFISWKSYTNQKLWRDFQSMRNIVLSSQNNKKTNSI